MTGFAAFWFAQDVNYTLIEGFRLAYELPERDGWWKDFALSSMLVFLTVVPFGVASIFLVFTSQIRDRLLPFFGIERSITGLITLSGWGVAFATIVLIIATLYYVAPNRKQHWRLVFPGALIATALWFLSTSLFAWYVQHLARYTDLYGSASTVIVLLIWVYIANLVILVGCEYNAVRELRRGATS
jgi:membrane protein